MNRTSFCDKGWIRIRQNYANPAGSGSATLKKSQLIFLFYKFYLIFAWYSFLTKFLGKICQKRKMVTFD
jgi:hypothetical protein